MTATVTTVIATVNIAFATSTISTITFAVTVPSMTTLFLHSNASVPHAFRKNTD